MKKNDILKGSLKNGFNFFLQSISESKSVSVYLTVKAGPRYEEKINSGLAHFLEHMLFEGTYRFDNAKKLADYIESVGGRSGAWTDKEYVTYYVKVLPEYIERAIDYLADILFNSQISDADIEKEKGIVVEENSKRNDSPELYVLDKWLEWTWGDRQSLGRSTLGDNKTISKLKKKRIMGYMDKLYTPSNMTIVVVGNMVKQNVKQYLERYFMPTRREYKRRLLPVKFLPKKNKIKFIKSNSEQSQICLGYVTGASYFDEDKFPLMLIAEILGGSTTSRLFYKLIYDLGIAYTAGTYNWFFNDTGLFIASTGVSIKNTNLAIAVILKEIEEIKKDLISDKELKSNKEKMKARLYYDFEATDSIAYFYSSQLSTEGKVFMPEELIGKINSVTTEDIRKIAVKYLNPKNLSILITGNLSQDAKKKITNTIAKSTFTGRVE